MEYILNNYLEVSKNEPLNAPLAKFIRTELPDQFKESIFNSDNYIIRGSVGMSRWAKVPWIYFLNKKVSSKFIDRYYVSYLFKEDMSGFYLSLMFDVRNYKNVQPEVLSKVSNYIIRFIQKSFPEIKSYAPIILNSHTIRALDYEKANIFSIEYQRDNLPSEIELKKDLKMLLRIYDIISANDIIDSLIEKYSYKTHISNKGFDDNKIMNELNYDVQYLDENVSSLETTKQKKDNEIENYKKNYIKKFDHSFNDKSQLESSNSLNKDNIISENQLDNKKSGINDFNNKIEISEIEFKPNKYYNFKKRSNKFKRLDELLSDDNVEKLEYVRYLEEEDFNTILRNIINTHEEVLKKLIKKNNICFEKLSILEKMFLFSKSFVITKYKRGGVDLGYYKFNEIYIDKREQSDYKKIRTIIHELSHFLFSEILEQILSEILDTYKTDMMEAFIFYILTDVNDFYLIDEYCACTVEGRFVPMGHQDYTSFKNCLEKEHNLNDGDISAYGNTFASHIMFIMESFISEDLIKEINNESSNINYHLNDDVKYETDEYVDWDDFVDMINMMLEYKTNFNTEEVEDIYGYYLEIQKNNN
ncbi:MrcB family domain-containing protein [Methanobrevibacter millerae]|nr:DUF3578 domain-containing protein [Methanobrevibacter millerae]